MLKTLGLTFKLCGWFLLVATPLLGVWLASSLVALAEGPQELVVAAGLLLFPGLPLAWELWGSRRHRRHVQEAEARGVEGPKRWLGFVDRMIVRTLAINAAFILVLLATNPEQGFVALATRGDWMLDGHQEPWSEDVRSGLFVTAQGIEWLHDAVRDNPYVASEQEEARAETFAPTSDSWGPVKAAPPGLGLGPNEAPPGGQMVWPWPAVPHPLVVDVPPEHEGSIEAVAAYVVQRERDPFLRVKALHDYVALRVEYDHEALESDRIEWSSQQARAVFRHRRAVCAGYSTLMVALGAAAGIEVVYLSGVTHRELAEPEASNGHAWNAVRIEGRWYLMDVTWDAGAVGTDGSSTQYETTWLLLPPAVMGHSRLPDDPRWQLRPDPLDRGTFLREPRKTPWFYTSGLTLKAPHRSEVWLVEPELVVQVENPAERPLTLFQRRGDDPSALVPCSEPGSHGALRCALPGRGVYDVRLGAELASGRSRWVLSTTVHVR